MLEDILYWAGTGFLSFITLGAILFVLWGIFTHWFVFPVLVVMIFVGWLVSKLDLV